MGFPSSTAAPAPTARKANIERAPSGNQGINRPHEGASPPEKGSTADHPHAAAGASDARRQPVKAQTKGAAKKPAAKAAKPAAKKAPAKAPAKKAPAKAKPVAAKAAKPAAKKTAAKHVAKPP